MGSVPIVGRKQAIISTLGYELQGLHERSFIHEDLHNFFHSLYAVVKTMRYSDVLLQNR